MSECEKEFAFVELTIIFRNPYNTNMPIGRCVSILIFFSNRWGVELCICTIKREDWTASQLRQKIVQGRRVEKSEDRKTNIGGYDNDKEVELLHLGAPCCGKNEWCDPSNYEEAWSIGHGGVLFNSAIRIWYQLHTKRKN